MGHGRGVEYDQGGRNKNDCIRGAVIIAVTVVVYRRDHGYFRIRRTVTFMVMIGAMVTVTIPIFLNSIGSHF